MDSDQEAGAYGTGSGSWEDISVPDVRAKGKNGTEHAHVS